VSSVPWPSEEGPRGDAADNPKVAMFGNVVLDMARKAPELSATTNLR
jgi:hypothetical protein